jgi:trans-aconitate methyltransferase
MRPNHWDAELYEARHSFVWHYGEELISILDPKPGERILDIGCGPGHLTHKIAEVGAHVIGLDASPEMVALARQNYPRLQFVLQDAAKMRFDSEFDAVFSNAALHWMMDASEVARGIGRALRPGGRLVAELGGKGNVAQIEHAVQAVAKAYLGERIPAKRTFFPSLAEYASILDAGGMETVRAHLFDRATPLEGANGMEQWIRQFMDYYFERLPPAEHERAIQETVERLRPVLFHSGKWMADYRRLRVVAVKPAITSNAG